MNYNLDSNDKVLQCLSKCFYNLSGEHEFLKGSCRYCCISKFSKQKIRI